MWDPGDDDGPYTPRLFGQTVTVLGERSLRQTAGAAPSFARAYLRARLTAPLRAHTDVPVVLGGDGATVLHHGAPSTWPSGVAERVQAGTLRVGVVRVRTRGAASGAARAPAHRRTASDGGGAAAVQPGPVATRRRSESNSVAGRLKVGVHADQGGCGHMEDMSVVHQSGSAEAPGVHAFCCVYDGHGGESAARFCCEQLHFNVMASAHFRRNEMHEALREGIRKTEADLIDEQRQRGLGGGGGGGSGSGGGGSGGGDGHDDGGGAVCGSTVLVSLLCADSLHIAWLGDCRAVLSRSGTAVQLTADHSLLVPSECARVEREGGLVEHDRLGGFLEVARALGDYDPAAGGKPAGLSSEPEITSVLLAAHDEFLVMGSDGLWAVMTPQEAVALARSQLLTYSDATMASEKLVEAALKRHADDNVTAMVIWFNPIPEAAAEVPRRPRLMLTKSKKEVAKEGTSDCGGVPSALMSELGQS